MLSLLANNTGQVDYAVAYRPLVLSLVVSALLLLAAKWLSRDWQKAGALVTVVNALFFSYGHAYTYFEDAQIAGILVGRHRVLGALWLGLLILSFWWIVRRKDLSTLTSSLNVITIFLLVFPVYTLLSFWYSNLDVHEAELSKDPTLESLTVSNASPDSPDVYFFVLDQYARADVLAEYFKYDNSGFLNSLQDLGFYVASCSQSNYPYTSASLAGTLNMDYIPELGDEFSLENKSFRPMQQAIKHSRVEAAFRKLDYRIVAFETGYNFTELEDADIFYKFPLRQINGFEALLLRSSAMLLPADFGLLDRYELTDDERKRDLTLFVLDQLEEVPALPGKKFVFVHLVVPHPPFVFGPNGEPLVIQPYYENGETGYKRDDFRKGYHNQVVFISARIVSTIEKIIENSPRPPIIIIQGDHGPITIPNEKRMNILNAYLFPGSQPDWYPTLSPVNNFRLVFNTYFNTSLPLLPDKSFRVDINRPYWFNEMKNPYPCSTSK